MTKWNVVFNPERLCHPNTIDIDSFLYQDAVRFLERNGFHVTVSDDADYEYFVEAMAKMNAVVNHLNVDDINLVVPGSGTHSAFDPELPTIGAIPNQYRFIPVGDGIWSYDDKAGAYGQLRTFSSFAGRYVYNPSYTDDFGGFEAFAVAQDYAVQHGFEKLGIKNMSAHVKAPLIWFNTSDDFYDVIPMELCDPGSYQILFQEKVDMFNEYRIFVVNGVPVSGAGCIESDTPLSHVPGVDFSVKVETVRNKGYVHDDAELVEQYRLFASDVAEKIAAETDGKLMNYVLDVAQITGVEGNSIGIVELNELNNSGLYAIDVDKVVEAQLQTPEFHQMTFKSFR